MNFPVKVFIINLEKDVDKRLLLESKCKSLGLDFEVIPAVNGKELSTEYIETIYSEKETIKNIRRPLTKGEIGCALSHILVYRKIIKNKIPLSLILEDDIDFSDDILKLLNSFLYFKRNWECILLGHHAGVSREIDPKTSFWMRERLLGSNFHFCRPIEYAYGAYGYIINEVGAKRLYDATQLIKYPIDHYTGNRKVVDLYVCIPPAILISEQYEDISNLTDDRDAMEKFWINKNEGINENVKLPENRNLIYRLLRFLFSKTWKFFYRKWIIFDSKFGRYYKF